MGLLCFPFLLVTLWENADVGMSFSTTQLIYSQNYQSETESFVSTSEKC